MSDKTVEAVVALAMFIVPFAFIAFLCWLDRR